MKTEEDIRSRIKFCEERAKDDIIHWKARLLYDLQAEFFKMILDEPNRFEQRLDNLSLYYIHKVD